MRAAFAALALWCGGVLWAPPALAHAVLLDSSPADGAVLDAPPAAVVLRFNEPVTPVDVRVIEGGGEAVAGGEARAVDRSVRIALPPALAEGTYVVSWRVASADAHPVAGALVFAVGSGSPSALRPAAPVSHGTAWTAAGMAARATLLAVSALVAGGALYAALIAPLGAGLGRTMRRVAWCGLVLAVLSVGLRGGLLLEAPSAALFAAAAWRAGAASSLGPSMALAATGFLLVAMSRPRAWMALPGALLVLASIPLAGHVAPAEPRWLTVPALALHGAAMAFWVGALPPLLAALGRDGRAAHAEVRRFSRLAVAAVAVLVASGLCIAAVQVGGLPALATTDYGRVLLGKLALVAGMIGLAIWNRHRLTPALARDGTAAARRLAVSIRAEIALAGLVLALTGVLGLTPPPRTGTADGAHQHAVPGGHTVAVPGNGRLLLVGLEPAGAGRARLDLLLIGPDGAAGGPAEVVVALANRRGGIEAMERRLGAVSPGRYRLERPELAIPGIWSVRVDVLISDFEKAIFRTELTVR